MAANEKARATRKFHESNHSQIEKANEMYKRKANKNRKSSIFQLRDLIWVHLRKEMFSSKRKNKIAPRVYDPFEEIAKSQCIRG